MGTTIEVEFGVTKRGIAKHLLVHGNSLCGQADADQLDEPGSQWQRGEFAAIMQQGGDALGGEDVPARIRTLPVCTRCAIHAAALHAAASDG